jgi:hypothetical protein
MTYKEVSRGGDLYEYPFTDYGRRAVALNFTYPNLASYTQARDEIVNRSLGKARPLLVIPHDRDPALAILCRLTNRWSAKGYLATAWNASSMAFEECPFDVAVR